MDRYLDTRVILSYNGNESVASFTRKFRISFQSAIHFSRDKTELSYFIPEEISENREIAMLLAQSKSERQGSVYFLSHDLMNEDLDHALNSHLTEEKTTVVDNLFLEGGVYKLSLRLHSSDLGNFSRSTLQDSKSLPGLGVSYVGPSPGMPAIMNEIKGSVGLKNFEFEAEVPEEIQQAGIFSILPDEWVGENRYLTSGKAISELVATDGVIEDAEKHGIVRISPDANLYSVPFNTLPQLLDMYFSGVYESRIIRFWRTLHYRNGILKFRIIVPEPLSEGYLRVLANCDAKYPDWNLIITNIDQL